MKLRNSVLLAGAGAATVAIGVDRVRGALQSNAKGRIVIVGGGTAGIDVAARLSHSLRSPDITIVEPSETHAYQPGWTLVASGVFPREHFIRREAGLIPRKARWIRSRVREFEPDRNAVLLEDGQRLSYDYLVVCPGHQLNYDKVEGLTETLGRNGVYSNYTGEGAEQTWQGIQKFTSGVALFTEPATPIKCGGAPQKIAYMADSYWRRNGVRDRIDERFIEGKGVLFSSPYYLAALEDVMAKKNITPVLNRDLIAVDGGAKEATFAVKGGADAGKTETMSYDFLHVCPPQSAPDFVKQSPLVDANGYVDVDKGTLQHVRYPNVFGLGDVSNLPTSKTGAAVRKQAPVVAHNLVRLMEGADLSKDSVEYHGYSSCPVVTDYGRMMLAEFDYTRKPTPTVPPWEHDSRKPTYANWLLKTRGLPLMYWEVMMRGLA